MYRLLGIKTIKLKTYETFEFDAQLRSSLETFRLAVT